MLFLPNNTSVNNTNTYTAIPIKIGIDKRLYFVASIKSISRIQMNPRVKPQPRHLMPNKLLIGHNEHPNNFVKKYKTAKKTLPAPNEYRECLFSIIFFLIL